MSGKSETAMTAAQYAAVTDAFTALRAIYETYKDGDRAELAVLAGESLAGLTAAFPHIAELDEACGAANAHSADAGDSSQKNQP